MWSERRKINFLLNLQQNGYLRTDMVREKEIKTFFENRSLNRGLLSLYEVKEEKSFEKMTEIRD